MVLRISFFLSLMTLPAPGASAQAIPDSVLEGLLGVNPHVILNYQSPPHLTGQALFAGRLQTVLELELRKAGVPINSTTAFNYLNVSITAVPDLVSGRLVGVSFSYNVEFFERVLSFRALLADYGRRATETDGAATYLSLLLSLRHWSDNGEWAVTWKGLAGIVGSPADGHRQRIESEVAELAQHFANAYLKANPR